MNYSSFFLVPEFTIRECILRLEVECIPLFSIKFSSYLEISENEFTCLILLIL